MKNWIKSGEFWIMKMKFWVGRCSYGFVEVCEVVRLIVRKNLSNSVKKVK